MIKKTTIAYIVFSILLCYIASPWFFERKFFLNELLACFGIFLLVYKHFKVGKDVVSVSIVFLLFWCVFHSVVSILRMDNVYYYLRNLVIFYSIFTFFVGYYLYSYLGRFLRKVKRSLTIYISTFLFIPVPRLFERFGMAVMFPAVVKPLANKWLLPLLIFINLIYSITYGSSTAFIIALFYGLILVVPGYRFFKQTIFLMALGFVIVFISLLPNLSLIAINYNYHDSRGIYDVMNSNKLLALDGNNTWRLVLWKQIIVDHFPANVLGLGFGTPVMRYFPIEDPSKIPSLPYVLGAHNSFVYLFGRLGIVYVLITLVIYREVFKEYFYLKSYYYTSKKIIVFWSFFAITIIALFNPVLESPIFAGVYWIILGLLAKTINERKYSSPLNTQQF